MKIKYPITAGILLLIIHAIFSPLFLYTRYPVLDIPMHFSGGLIVAWFYAAYFKNERNGISRLGGALLIIGGTALVGVLWEFLEWSLDNFVFIEAQFMGGLNDTLFDLAMDLTGGLVVTLFFQKRKSV